LTFEVSADVGAEHGAAAKKTPRKRSRAITGRRVTPVETTAPAAQTIASSATSSSAHAAVPARRAIHLQMLAAAMVMICVVTLTVSRRPAPLAAAGAADAQPERLQQSSDLAPVAQPAVPALAPIAAGVAVAPAVAPRAVSEAAAKAALQKSEKTRIAEATSPTAAVAAIDEALAREDASTKFAPSESISADPASASVDPAVPGTVTVTGCLETSGKNQFRLTDTEGVDAPKSRSWRSGFLKKSSTSVALVAPPDPYTLQTQAGQRITATGQMTNRELRVTSLQVIGTRCD